MGLWALVALVLLCFAFGSFGPRHTVSAATGINHQINFQGKLVNTNGTNVTDGSYSIVFSIYNVASAGSSIWTETQTVTVTNGIFQVNLGSVTPLPGSVDFNTDNIYLGIKVGTDAEMTPRIQFTAVPQAFNSEKLGGLDKTGFIQNSVSQQAAANFNISGAGIIGTTLTTPVLQSAAATALTITGNAASTWSTSAGNITLQAGSGTVSLGSTTTLTSTGSLSITGGTSLALTSTGTAAISLDSGTTGAVNVGTNANAKTVTIGNNTGASSTIIHVGTGGLSVGDDAVATTINIGGVVNNGADTVNIATNNTSADTVTIGSTNAGSTTKLQAGAASLNVANAGLTIAGNTVSSGTISTTVGGATGAGTQALASNLYVQSRGTNLVTNGTGLLGNNYNFSGFTYDAQNVYAGAGSFKNSTFSTSAFSDELIPVDPSSTYQLTLNAEATTYVAGSHAYFGVATYDVDGNAIDPTDYAKFAGSTDTTLAAPLNPGDTTITLTNATGWWNGGGASGTYADIAWYGYTNSKGYTYPDYTYTRNRQTGQWAAGGITGNVITLSAPWAGPALPNGASVRNTQSGGTYKYIAAVNVNVPATWTTYSGRIGQIDTNGTQATNLFPYGTAYTKLLFLMNRDVAGNTTNVSDLSFTNNSGVFSAPTSGTTPLIAQGAASQSVDLFQIQNSVGSILSKFDSSGNLTAPNGIFTGSIQGNSSLTLGTSSSVSGSIVLKNSTNSNAVTLTTAAQTGNFSLTIPILTANDTICTLGTGCGSASGTAGGDLSGTYPNPTVAKIQGQPVTYTTLANNNMLVYNGSAWVNATAAGDITNSVAGNTNTFTIAAGAVTGTKIAATTITAGNIANNTITNNQIASGSFTNITGVGTLTAGTWNASTVGVQYGGTGAATLASNGVLYGNGTGAVQATAVGATGQCLIGTTGAAPSWGSCTTLTATNGLNIASNQVGLGGTLNNSTTTLTSAGAASALVVTSAANVPTADQFNITNAGSTGVVTAGVNALSINYKGGAAAVEAGAQRIDLQAGATSGGTWNGSRIVANATGPATGVTLNGVKLEGPATTGGAGTYNAINVANIGTVAAGGIVRGLNITATNSNAAGTVRGIQLNNITAGAASEIGVDLGTGWDNLITYNNGATVIVNGAGQLNVANATGTLANANLVNSGALTVTAGTGLSGGGSVALGATTTLSLANTTVTAASYGSASSVATFTVNAQGQLTTAASTAIAIAATQITSGNYVATLGALTGLTTTLNSGTGSTPTLAVTYGAAANTAAQGNTALTFNGSGNLTGSISGTAGGGFTTTTLALINNPSFTGLVTANGGLTVGSTTVIGQTNFTDGTADGFTGTLQLAGAIAANQTYLLPTAGGTFCLSTNNCSYAPVSGSANYIQNQSASPQAGASFNVAGTGAVSGAFTGGSTITGTTLNGTTGINSGAGAGTQRIDASGNLLNIGTIANSGSIATTGTTEVTYKNLYNQGSSTASVTGTLELILPNGWTNTMLTATLKGYDYSSIGAWQATVGGYNYVTTPAWINTSAEVSGNAPFTSVRLAYDTVAAKTVLLFGTTATVWHYPQITLDSLVAGFGNTGIWGSGYSSAFLASEANITTVSTPVVKTVAYQNQVFMQGGNSFGATATLGTNDAQSLVLETGGSARLTVTSAGAATFSGPLTVSSGGVTVTGNSTITGTLGSLTGLSSSGAIAFSGLSTNGVVQTTGGTGTLTAGALNLATAGNVTGTLPNANLVSSGALTVTAGTGLSGGGLVSLGGTTTLNVTYGAAANTAAQGNTALTFNGSGNLTGSISGTAGGGFTTNTLALVNNPSFTGLVTANGGLSVGSTTVLGKVSFTDGTADGFTGGIQLAGAIAANQTYTLPTAGGTFCLNTNNCSYAPVSGSANYIQNSVSQQAASNFNISGAGVIGTTLTTPVLQSAAATALTITGNAASTWSTSAGNITLQAGSGTVSLGTSTNLTASGSLTIRSGGATVASYDTGGAAALGLGDVNANAITVGNTANTVTTTVIATTTLNLGTNANNKTINLGAVAATANTTAVNVATSTGAAQTVKIGGTGGAVANSNAGTTITAQAGAAALSLTNTGILLQTYTNSSTAFQIQDASNAPVFLVDTTSTTSAGTQLNYLTYPGFESGAFNNAAAGWNKAGAATLTQNVSKQHTFNGIASAQVATTAAAGDGLLTTSFAAVPSTVGAWDVSFYAKLAGGTMASTLFTVTSTDGAAHTCSPAAGTTINSSGFQRLSCTFTTTGTITQLQIAQNDATARTLYIDGVQLQTGAVATPYQIGAVQIRGTITNPVTIMNNGDSTSAFQVQNAAGTSNSFVVDTLNNKTSVGGTLSVASTSSFGGNLAVTAGGVTVTGNSTITGTLGSLTGLSSSGAIAFSGLSTNGVVQTTGGTGTLTAGALNLATAGNVTGTLPNANLVNGGALTVAAGTGLTGGGPVALGATTTLTLANTTVTAASYGSASSVATFTVNAQGQLTTAASTAIAIAATQITSGNYVATLGALTGLTTTLNSGTGSTPTLAVTYGAAANTAAQGNTALTFNGSGNLTGSISGTAGGGFTTTTLALINNPSFTGLVTANGGLTVGSTTVIGQTNFTDGTADGFTGTIKLTGAIAANQTYLLPTSGGTFCLSTNNCSYAPLTGGTGYIQNQSASAQTVANYWVSGSGRADTSLLTPTLDTATAVALNIGNTNATAINIGKQSASNIATTIYGTTLVKPTTGNDSTTAFQIQNAGGNNILTVDSTLDSRNLITNPSFETNTNGWAAKGAATIARSTAQSYFGKASMLITTTAAANDGAKYNLTLSPNTNYTFVIDFFTTAGMTTLVNGYSSDGVTETTYVSSNTTNAAGTWSTATVTFTTPATFSGTPYFFIKQTDATARSIYIDATQAVATTPGLVSYNDSRITLGSDAATELGINTTTPNAALEIDQKINQTGLLIRGAGPIASIYEQLPLDVQSSNGLSHLQFNEITDQVIIHGGNAFWNSAGLDVFSDDPGGRGISVTGASGGAQTADLLQAWSGAGGGRTNTKMFGIDGNGGATFRNYADSTAALQVLKSDSSVILNVDSTNKRVGINTATPGYSLDVNGSARVGGQAVNGIFSILTTSSRPILVVDSTATNQISLQTFAAATAGTQTHNAMGLQFTGNYWNGSSSVNQSYNVTQVSATSGILSRLAFQNNAGTEVASFNDDGSVAFKTSTNTTTAFQIQNASATPVLKVDTTNSFVGIGTAAGTPGYTLDVQSTSTAASGSNANTNSIFTATPASAPAAATYYIGTQNIAQTSSANANANTNLLGALGRSSITGSASVGTTTGVQGDVYNSGSGIVTQANGLSAAILNNGTGSITNGYALYVQSPGAATGSIGSAVGVYIAPQKVTGVTNGWAVYQAGTADKSYFGGQVGFGTSTMDGAVNIAGSQTWTTALWDKGIRLSTINALELGGGSGAPFGLGVTNTSGISQLYLWSTTAEDTSAAPNYIMNASSVGVSFQGVGTPNAPVQIGTGAAAGSGYVKTLSVDGTGGGSSCGAVGCPMIMLNTGGANGNIWGTGVDGTADWVLDTQSAGVFTTRVMVQNNGNTTVHGSASTCTLGNVVGAVSCTSDARLKNIVDHPTDNLSRLMQIQPTRFTWKDPSLDQQVEYGLIAQEVQAQFPSMVVTNPNGYLALDYAALVAPLIGAVQQEEGQITTLNNNVTALQNSSLANGGSINGALTVNGPLNIAGSSNFGGDISVTGSASIGGNLNVTGSTTLATLTVTGSTTLNSDLTVKGITNVTDIVVSGHIITAGNAPTVAVLPAAGSSNATTTITGNDTSGTITITVGDPTAHATANSPEITGPTIGDLLKLSFNKPYGKQPRIMLSGNDANSLRLLAFPGAPATDSFNLSIGSQPTPNTTYSFNYWTVE